MADDRSKERDLILKWQAEGAPKNSMDFVNLAEGFRPLVMKYGRKYIANSNLPQVALEGELMNILYDALRKYDPSRGTLPSTHIIGNYIPQVGRYIRKYQNVARAPDDRSQLIGTFKNRVDTLRSELGREPAAHEIADDMGIPMSQVEFLRKEIRNDLIGTDYMADMTFSNQYGLMDKIDFLYYELPREEQIVLEYTYGLHGQPKLGDNAQEISNKSGIPLRRVYTLKNSIADKVETLMKKH